MVTEIKLLPNIIKKITPFANMIIILNKKNTIFAAFF